MKIALLSTSDTDLLSARHCLVLHEVGQAPYVTIGRSRRESVVQDQDNFVVMLNRTIELDGLEDWQIWWGGNLGSPSEELVPGREGDVIADIEAARNRAKQAAGWAMDIYLLRRTS